MRGIIYSLAVAASLAMSGIATAAPDDRFVGPWSGRCGHDVQCKLEIAARGDTYEMTLRVADALDYEETVCIIEAELEAFAPDVLVSGDRSVRLMLERTGDVIVSGLPTDECSGAVINGAYTEYLDE